MTERQLRLRLGLFALVALLLLGTMLVLFGSFPTFFKRGNPYTIVFDDATGIRSGTPVRLSGVPIGEVTGLALNDVDGRVRVQVEIDKRYTVRRNEQPTLMVSLLGTDAAIDFVPRPPPKDVEPDRSPIPPGSEIEGVRQVNVSALLKGASEVVPTTQETLNDIRKSLRRFEEMAPLMEQTMKEYRDLGRAANKDYPDLSKSFKDTNKALQDAGGDIGATAREYRRLGENLNVLLQGNQDKVLKALDELNRKAQRALDNLNYTLERVAGLLTDENIRYFNAILKNVKDASDQAPPTAKNIRDASDSLPSIAKNTDELVKESRQTLKHLDATLSRADAAMIDIQKATGGLSERGPSISRNLDESLEKLNRTMTDVRELMRVVGQSDGTLKRVLTDPSLYNNLDAAACQIAKMLPRLDRILKDLETFADKLARHPEAIGLGGLARPGSGLKDAPPVAPLPHP